MNSHNASDRLPIRRLALARSSSRARALCFPRRTLSRRRWKDALGPGQDKARPDVPYFQKTQERSETTPSIKLPRWATAATTTMTGREEIEYRRRWRWLDSVVRLGRVVDANRMNEGREVWEIIDWFDYERGTEINAFGVLGWAGGQEGTGSLKNLKAVGWAAGGAGLALSCFFFSCWPGH